MYVGSIIANQAALPPEVVAGGGGAALYAGLFRTLCEVAAAVVVVLALLEPLTRRWDQEHVTVIGE